MIIAGSAAICSIRKRAARVRRVDLISAVTALPHVSNAVEMSAQTAPIPLCSMMNRNMFSAQRAGEKTVLPSTKSSLRLLALLSAIAILESDTQRNTLLAILAQSTEYRAATAEQQAEMEKDFLAAIHGIVLTLQKKADRLLVTSEGSCDPLWWQETSVIVADAKYGSADDAWGRYVFTVRPSQPKRYYHGVGGTLSHMTPALNELRILKVYRTSDFMDRSRSQIGEVDWDRIEHQYCVDFPLKGDTFDPACAYGGWVSPSGIYHRAKYMEHESIAYHMMWQKYGRAGNGDDLLARGWMKIDFTGDMLREQGRRPSQEQLNALHDISCAMQGSTTRFKKDFDRCLRHYLEG